MRRKIVRAGGKQPSYAAASEELKELAELNVPPMQVARVTQEIGEELIASREERVALHRRGELPADDGQPPVQIACIETDGGRIFTRAAGNGRGVHEAQWKEDKVACLWRMRGKTYDKDPHPELPRCFQDEQHVRQLVRGLHGSAGSRRDEEDDTTDQTLGKKAGADEPRPSSRRRRWQPERVWRTCVATLQDVHAFGWQVAAEAQRRGFYQAKRKAFLGDGQQANWTVHKTHFPHFTAVLDFVHAVAYLFQAAGAVTSSPAAKWEQYIQWATAAWQGRIDDVIADLQRWQQILGELPEKPSADDPGEVVRRTLGYLQNNRQRMNYPEYRREGLPITSALVESLIKQFNRRVKGTDKFWNRPAGAEAILQVAGCLLCDGDPLLKHLQTRPISHRRPYRKK